MPSRTSRVFTIFSQQSYEKNLCTENIRHKYNIFIQIEFGKEINLLVPKNASLISFTYQNV